LITLKAIAKAAISHHATLAARVCNVYKQNLERTVFKGECAGEHQRRVSLASSNICCTLGTAITFLAMPTYWEPWPGKTMIDGILLFYLCVWLVSVSSFQFTGVISNRRNNFDKIESNQLGSVYFI